MKYYIHKNSLEYSKYIIKYLPIYNNLLIYDDDIRCTLYELNMHIELQCKRYLAVYKSVFFLRNNFNYILYPKIYLNVHNIHTTYKNSILTYKNTPLDKIIKYILNLNKSNYLLMYSKMILDQNITPINILNDLIMVYNNSILIIIKILKITHIYILCHLNKYIIFNHIIKYCSYMMCIIHMIFTPSNNNIQ